jgi:hypothetical protein
MAFKSRSGAGAVPDDPESLLRDLRKRTITGLISHQADIIRSYLTLPADKPDVALQLPTGSGKTLVGLLIAEWRRRKYRERVVYLCPTNQLVNQVAEHARTKYGMDLHAFTGRKSEYDPSAMGDWQNGDAIAITNYSSLFNVNPFFADPHLIVLDDAHSAENYIASYWSVQIDRFSKEHAAAFSAVMGLLVPLLPPADRGALLPSSGAEDEGVWVNKIPTPSLYPVLGELRALLDEHTKGSDLRYPWQVVRHSLEACHVYLSSRSVLIRPLIPPSNTHAGFAGARQRLYMSATLGAGGDLERITGRPQIERVPVPHGWDKQGIGRRFFLFPKRALDDEETSDFAVAAIERAGRALYLVPDDRSAKLVSEVVKEATGFKVFDAKQLEDSKAPFISEGQAVAVVANRYDGIDLVDAECRLLLVHGLPRGANLQERFFVTRVGAQLLLDDRILTRVVQGFGRCTRSANDYAAVIVLGENLHKYLLTRERREFFHPEIQAELEFGLDEAKDATAAEMLENLGHFLKQDTDWEDADEAIVGLRSGLKQKLLPATEQLAATVGAELAYQAAMWNGDFKAALGHCRTVLGKLDDGGLRGYRALWLYLAGSAAWLAAERRQLGGGEVARGYFAKAQSAAPALRWLVDLQRMTGTGSETAPAEDGRAYALVERIETVFESFGTTHDRKFDAEEAEVLKLILQDDDGTLFEQGRERLGRLLGFEVGHSDDEAAPDPWWIVDSSLCFAFEDHAEGKVTTVFSPTKARQAASHPDWLRSELKFDKGTVVVAVLITPCEKTSKGAVPHLKKVRYWKLKEFRVWAQQALQALRDLRRGYPGEGSLDWRREAAEKLRASNIAPQELTAMLGKSAADAMTLVESAGGSDEEDGTE